MDEFKTTTGNTYGIIFGYGILKQIEGSIFNMVEDDTIEKMKEKAKAAQNNGGADMLNEEEVWEFFSVKDFRSIMIGNIDYSLKTMATMIRKFNGESVGSTFEERYDFVLGMNEDDGRQLGNYISDRVAEFQEGRAAQGESKPSSKKLEEGKVHFSPPTV